MHATSHRPAVEPSLGSVRIDPAGALAGRLVAMDEPPVLLHAVEGRDELLARRGRIDEAARLLRFVVTFEHTRDWIRAAAQERLDALAGHAEGGEAITLDELRAAMIPS